MISAFFFAIWVWALGVRLFSGESHGLFFAMNVSYLAVVGWALCLVAGAVL